MLNAPKETDFLTRFGQTIAVLAMSANETAHFFYEHVPTGRRFDIRDLPHTFIGSLDSRYTNERQLRTFVEQGNVEAHRRALYLALLHSYDFEVFRTPQDVRQRILVEGLVRADVKIPNRLMQIAVNGEYYFGKAA